MTRLGVLGSMVWDRIEHPDAPVVERWGGIAYSLAAAAAVIPSGWTIRPIIKVGGDLAGRAAAFFDTVPGLERPGGVVEVDAPNNRVHLSYRDRHHRHECMTGGVPAWAWPELRPHLDGLDALFVNLISGFELELETAERLRDAFPGPIYVDLHSLLLGVATDGHREPRPLDEPRRWLAAFDVVQVNEPELALVAGDAEPWALAEEAVARGLGALLVTRGPEGAAWVAPGDRPFPWRTDPERAGGANGGGNGRSAGGGSGEEPGAVTGVVVVRGEVPVEPVPRGDPTGCGDVWGATCFVALVQGERLTAAMAAANRAAAHNVAHRGADGLQHHLRTES